MRELIRLLSSHLPVGKIPGIWEFIFPLRYNSLILTLYCCHTLCHKIQEQSPINLVHSPCSLLLLTTSCLLLFLFFKYSAEFSLKFRHIIVSRLCIITHYSSSGSSPHPSVIMSSVHFKPSFLRHLSYLSLFCLVSSILRISFSLYSQVIACHCWLYDFDTSLPCCLVTYPIPKILLCRHGDSVCLCKSCHRFGAGERGMMQGAFSWQVLSHKKVSRRKEESRTTKEASEKVSLLNPWNAPVERSYKFYPKEDLFWGISC